MKTWISIHGYLFSNGIHCRMSLHGYPCLDNINVDIHTCMDNWRMAQKIMDIHVDIRGFVEIHAWICYGFSDQGIAPLTQSCTALRCRTSMYATSTTRLAEIFEREPEYGCTGKRVFRWRANRHCPLSEISIQSSPSKTDILQTCYEFWIFFLPLEVSVLFPQLSSPTTP